MGLSPFSPTPESTDTTITVYGHIENSAFVDRCRKTRRQSLGRTKRHVLVNGVTPTIREMISRHQSVSQRQPHQTLRRWIGLSSGTRRLVL